MKAPFLKTLFVGLALAAALAAPIFAAESPDAVTVPSELLYIQGPGGNSDLSQFQNFRGGPGGGGPLFPSDYLGHELGGPGNAAVVSATPSPTVASSASGFDWADAGVGAGFVAGIALLVGAGLLAWSRRRPLVHA